MNVRHCAVVVHLRSEVSALTATGEQLQARLQSTDALLLKEQQLAAELDRNLTTKTGLLVEALETIKNKNRSLDSAAAKIAALQADLVALRQEKDSEQQAANVKFRVKAEELGAEQAARKQMVRARHVL